MGDAEALALRPGHPFERGVALLISRHLLKQVVVRSIGHEHLLVDQGEQALGLGFQELGDRGVISKVERGARHALRLALRLLHAEDELVEEVLQLLVGEVDEELLERVVLEGLEAEDVQEADRALGVPHRGLVCGAHLEVDPDQDPLEEGRVDRLGQRVACGGRLWRGLRHLDHGELADRLDGQRRLERRRLEPQQGGGGGEAGGRGIVHPRPIVLLGQLHRSELEVAEVEGGR